MLSNGQYSLSRHALRRMVERNISDAMIRDSGVAACLIEDYPDDKYSPSCLVLGFTDDGNQPLHVQVSRSLNPTVHIITLYVPSPEMWIEGYTRRR